MHTFLKKGITFALIASFAITHVALAQTMPDASATTTPASSNSSVGAPSAPASEVGNPPVPPVSPVSADSASSTLTQPIALQASPTLVQHTAAAQTTVTGDMLESTANPETGSTSQSISIPLASEPAIAATSTPQPVAQLGVDPGVPVEQSTTALHIVALNVITDPTTQTSVRVVPPHPVSLQDLTPQPDFTFTLTGKQIPTQRNLEDNSGAVVGKEIVAAPLASQVDNTKGVVSVSGQCSDTNFVVLLFKNATDYAQDPRSYIVNRAYPCVGGAFSYLIGDLPSSLPNGNYYLLVGEEGSRGAWKPITSLTEISINKNN